MRNNYNAQDAKRSVWTLTYVARARCCYPTWHPSADSKGIRLGLVPDHTFHFFDRLHRDRERDRADSFFSIFSTLFVVASLTMHCVGRWFRRLRLSSGVSKPPTLVSYIAHTHTYTYKLCGCSCFLIKFKFSLIKCTTKLCTMIWSRSCGHGNLLHDWLTRNEF